MIRFQQRPMVDRVSERLASIIDKQRAQANSVAGQSAKLDAALQQPIADVAGVDGMEDAVVMKALGI